MAATILILNIPNKPQTTAPTITSEYAIILMFDMAKANIGSRS